jgi:hypothetical protein
MQYFVTVTTHANNAKGKWVAENIRSRLHKTIVSEDNLPEMRKWIHGVIKIAKENFPRCKFKQLEEHEGPKGSVIEGLITITYSARENPDYPDVIINMTPAWEVRF